MIIVLLCSILQGVQCTQISLSYLTFDQTNQYTVSITIQQLAQQQMPCTLTILFDASQAVLLQYVSKSDNNLAITKVLNNFCTLSISDCSKTVSLAFTNISLVYPVLPYMNVTLKNNAIQTEYNNQGGIDPNTISNQILLQQDSLECFELTKLKITISPYFYLLIGSTFEIIFPKYLSGQSQYDYIDIQTLSCLGLNNIEVNLQCSFQNGILTISNLYTQPRILTYNNVSFQVSGFRNSYIIQDIQINLRTYYNGTLSVGDSYGTLSVNQIHRGTYTLSSSNNVRIQQTTLNLNVLVDSFLTSTSTIQIMFPFQVTSSNKLKYLVVSILCIKNCNSASISYQTNQITLSVISATDIQNDNLIISLTNFVNPDIGQYMLQITVIDNNNNIISTGLSSLSVIANQITDLKLALNNTKLGQPSLYSFSWTTPFSVTPGSILQIHFPFTIPSSGFINSNIFYFTQNNTMVIYNYFFTGGQSFQIQLPLTNPFVSAEGIYISVSFNNKIVLQSNVLSQNYDMIQLTVNQGQLTSPDINQMTTLLLDLSLTNICQKLIATGIDFNSTCSVNHIIQQCQNGEVSINGVQQLIIIFQLSYPRSNKPLFLNISAYNNDKIIEQVFNYQINVPYVRPLILQNSLNQFMIYEQINSGEQFTINQNFSSQSIKYHQVGSNFILDAPMYVNTSYDIVLSENKTTSLQFLTIDGYLLCQQTIPYTKTIQTQSSYTTSFPLFNIQPSNLYLYQSVSYNVQFTNTISITDYLFLELEQNVQYAYCQLQICTPYQNGLKIVFNSTLLPGNHSFQISNIQNPNHAGIFSYSLTNPGIESAIFSLYTMFVCPDNCKNCTLQQDGVTQCLECNDGFTGSPCTRSQPIIKNFTCPLNCDKCLNESCLECKANYKFQFGVCVLQTLENSQQIESAKTYEQSFYLIYLTAAVALVSLLLKFQNRQRFYLRMFIGLIQSYELIADILITVELAVLQSILFYIALCQLIMRQIQLLILNSYLKTQTQSIKGVPYQLIKVSSVYYSWKVIFLFSSRLTKQMNQKIQFNQHLIIDTSMRFMLLVALGLNYNIINQDYFYFSLLSIVHQALLCSNIKSQDQRLQRKLVNI